MNDLRIMEARRPEKLGRYSILGELGRGGMGVVYRAQDPKLGREVAIKVLTADSATDPERLKRFKREAKLLAVLNHPNIATIFDLDETNNQPFIAQELVEGRTLAELISSEALALDETVAACCQIATALEAAHNKNIVHRDLKPANVKISPEGLVKVLDFGVATMLDSDEFQSTVVGRVAGTLGYMSPEQLNGDRADARTDIWALGCILYECLTTQPAFPGKNFYEVMYATQNRDPRWDVIPDDVPDSLVTVVKRCLAKDPMSRYQSAWNVGTDLQNVQRDALHTAPSKPAEEPREAPLRTNPGGSESLPEETQPANHLIATLPAHDRSHARDSSRSHALLRFRQWISRQPRLGVGVVLALLATATLLAMNPGVIPRLFEDSPRDTRRVFGPVNLSGLVLDQQSRPVPNALVTVDGYVFQARSSPQGEFRGDLARLSEGELICVRVSHDEYVTATRWIAPNTTEVDTLRFRLDRATAE